MSRAMTWSDATPPCMGEASPRPIMPSAWMATTAVAEPKAASAARREMSPQRTRNVSTLVIFMMALPAFPQDKLEPEIDTPRSRRIKRQFGGRAANGDTMDADRADGRREQPTHLEVAKPDDGDRLGRTDRSKQVGAAHRRQESDGVGVVGREDGVGV